MKSKILLAGLLAATTALSGCSDDEVGDVSLGMFTMKVATSITQLLP
ncbi:hypothetical protein [Photobacterium rosenbergii]|nr:hypothetical protein [Photobacterium rosenbergii]MBY5944932.1 hypothetical protein [Photobacterium rosenbergii]